MKNVFNEHEELMEELKEYKKKYLNLMAKEKCDEYNKTKDINEIKSLLRTNNSLLEIIINQNNAVADEYNFKKCCDEFEAEKTKDIRKVFTEAEADNINDFIKNYYGEFKKNGIVR